jgi:heterodisulfide reductase subunit D
MFDLTKVEEQFGRECLGCGLCLEVCPIIPNTALKGVDPEKIMREILDLFQHKKIGDLARTRIYSCLSCNTCLTSCPQALNPGLGFAVAKAILQEIGDPIPKGVASILTVAQTLIDGAIPSFQGGSEKADWLITDPTSKREKPAKTVLFSSCFGLIQREVVATAIKILQRIDPTVVAFGGFNACCGELQLIAGKPEEAERQFRTVIEGIDTLAPEEVVIFCPTCQMNFDHHNPDTQWSWSFITDFIIEHLDDLGPLKEIKATVTIHDPCHFVRGEKPGSESPRKILQAIPGLKIIEMENTGENALCCGAYAITGAGRPGFEFRDRRLKQAQDTGADILSLYCPGCQIVLGPEGPNRSLQVESILTLLAESLGIK